MMMMNVRASVRYSQKSQVRRVLLVKLLANAECNS